MMFRRSFVICLVLITCWIKVQAQTAPPEGITYQAVLMNKNNLKLPGRDIKDAYLAQSKVEVRFSIVQDPSTINSPEYQELHSTTTDDYGLINLVIGQGNAISGAFMNIQWENDPKWLVVEIQLEGGGTFETYSIERMWSVPYALYSKESRIADSLKGGVPKHYQLLSIDGDTLFISGGNGVVLPGSVGGDIDSTNELQTLSITGDSISISSGNQIVITHPVNHDNDSLNELQFLVRSNDSLTLSKSNTVSIRDSDADSTNEIQDLFVKDDSLFITKSKDGIPISKFGTTQSADGVKLPKTITMNPCYQAINYLNVDSILGKSNSPYSLLTAFGDNYLVKAHGGTRRMYILNSTGIVKEISMDSVRQADHYNRNFVGEEHESGGGTSIFCYDSTGQKLWSRGLGNVGQDISGRFVHHYFVGTRSNASGDYKVVDLNSGSIVSVKDGGQGITPSGYCTSSGLFSYYSGQKIGSSCSTGEGGKSTGSYLSTIEIEDSTRGYISVLSDETVAYSLKHYFRRIYSVNNVGRIDKLLYQWNEGNAGSTNSRFNSVGITKEGSYVFWFSTSASSLVNKTIVSKDFVLESDYLENAPEAGRRHHYFAQLSPAGEFDFLAVTWPNDRLKGSSLDSDLYIGVDCSRSGGTCVNGVSVDSDFVVIRVATR